MIRVWVWGRRIELGPIVGIRTTNQVSYNSFLAGIEQPIIHFTELVPPQEVPPSSILCYGGGPRHFFFSELITALRPSLVNNGSALVLPLGNSISASFMCDIILVWSGHSVVIEKHRHLARGTSWRIHGPEQVGGDTLLEEFFGRSHG